MCGWQKKYTGEEGEKRSVKKQIGHTTSYSVYLCFCHFFRLFVFALLYVRRNDLKEMSYVFFCLWRSYVERELYSTPLISFSYLLSCEYLMPQNPHSHKMNTNIMQMYMCTSTWLILTKKANKIQAFQMGETNRHAPLFSCFFANFFILLLICSVVTFIRLQNLHLKVVLYTVFGSFFPAFRSSCFSILAHSIQLNSSLPYIFI